MIHIMTLKYNQKNTLTIQAQNVKGNNGLAVGQIIIIMTCLT